MIIYSLKSSLLLLTLCSCTLLVAQENYQVQKAKMTIEGTSSLHDWVSDVTILKAEAILSLEDPNKIEIEHLLVKIPAKGIISPKGKLMDKKTYKALKSTEFPEIQYKLTQIQAQSGDEMTVVGALTIAGQAKEIRLSVNSIRSGEAILFSGKHTLKMTDYKVEPPTALMGTIKTGNEVTIAFELSLIPTGGDPK